MSINYFLRIGDADTKKRPGGIYREIDDEGGLEYQFLNARGEWETNMDISRHFSGPDFTTDLISVSLPDAEAAIESWNRRHSIPPAPGA